MKKMIISKTILFAIIMAYIFLFKFLFGDNNILVAVMSITGILMFLERDLTGAPVKNTFGLVFFYLLIGVGTFIAAQNILIAIPINFLIVFFISYSFGHVLKNPMYIPFTFLYLFLLAYPVPSSAMPLRLLSLFVGAVSIMIPQFLFNKNKIEKASYKIFTNLLLLLNQKITLIIDHKSTEDIDLNISKLIHSLKTIIYDKKEKDFYIVEEGCASLNILNSLEKLNLLISDKDVETPTLNSVSKFLNHISTLLTEKNPSSINTYMDTLISSYSNSNNISDIQILSSMIFLKDSMVKILENSTKPKSLKKYNLKNDVYDLKNIKFNSIKTTYAFRIAIEICLACFIMDYFHLHQGRWIMYTVLSLTNPLYEVTKSKAKDRIIATTIGAIFIAITFTIFKDNVVRSLIVVLAGYFNIYCVTYRQKIVFVTMSAIGAAIMVSSGTPSIYTPLSLSLQRIGFILFGAVIALLINKFIFKYDAVKCNENLTSISNDLLKDLYRNIDKIFEKDNLNHYINTVYILVSQINETIKNNTALSKKQELTALDMSLINQKLMFISTVYELNNFVNTNSISDAKKDNFKNLFKEDKLSNTHITSFKALDDRIIYSSLLELKAFCKY